MARNDRVLESIRKAQNLSVSEGFLGRKPGFPDRLLVSLTLWHALIQMSGHPLPPPTPRRRGRHH